MAGRAVAGMGAVVIALGVLAGCGGSQDEPAATPTNAGAVTAKPTDLPEGQAALRVSIADCVGCTVNLQSAPAGELLWESGWTQVAAGSQWLLVPEDRLNGLSMRITSPAVPDQAIPTNVAVLYEGLEPGKTVNPGSIAGYANAYGCWSDTAARAWVAGSITVHTQVVKVDDQTRLLAYVGVGMEPYGAAQPTQEGVLISSTPEFLSCGG